VILREEDEGGRTMVTSYMTTTKDIYMRGSHLATLLVIHNGSILKLFLKRFKSPKNRFLTPTLSKFIYAFLCLFMPYLCLRNLFMPTGPNFGAVGCVVKEPIQKKYTQISHTHTDTLTSL